MKSIFLNRHPHMPIQPEFERNTEGYVEFFDPATQILFYQFKTTQNAEYNINALPDGCIDIIFCCHKEKYYAEICGSVLQSRTIKFLPETEYYGLRFLPNKDILQSNLPTKEFIGKQILLNDAISFVQPPTEKIISEKSFTNKIYLTKSLLLPKIFSNKGIPVITLQALDKIYRTRGNITMKEIGLEFGYSTRYIRKQFEAHIGISPKLFCRIVRFQSSLSMLLNQEHNKPFDIIATHGFYDQAHFINEFKSFGCNSPLQFQNNIIIN